MQLTVSGDMADIDDAPSQQCASVKALDDEHLEILAVARCWSASLTNAGRDRQP